jgi:hypothetical protein
MVYNHCASGGLDCGREEAESHTLAHRRSRAATSPSVL